MARRDQPGRGGHGDLDGDGDLDLVTSNSQGMYLGVVLAAGKGVPPVVPEYGSAIGPGRLLTADFNRDGNPDVALARNPAVGINLLFGANNGSFGGETNLPGVTSATALATGDWNGDGKLDLAAVGAGSVVWTHLGNGDGTFQNGVSYETGRSGSVQVLALADFNGDKRLDLLTVNSLLGLVLLGGNGDGTFKAAVTSPYREDFPVDIVAGDFDGDGRLDAALLRAFNGDVAIEFGDGTGRFARSVDLPIGMTPTRILAADLNGDGRLDIAVSNAGPGKVGTVCVLINNGMGTFAVPVHYTIGFSPRSIARGDVDGDGLPDLVASNNGAIVVLGAKGDGTFRDAVTYGPSNLGGFGSYIADLAVVDVNRDGHADIVHRTGDLSSVGVMLSAGCL